MSTKINNGLFMGDVDAAQDGEFLNLNGIEFIVNCVPREVPNVFETDGIQYMACDMAEQPESIFFDLRNQEFIELIEFMEHAMKGSLSLLVHSLDGQSRSPCVMIAYLMMKYQWSLDKAYEYVKMKRPDIQPHEGYLEQLSLLDTQISKKYRVPEKKRREWDPTHTDSKTDELVLVNTFLNVTLCLNPIPPSAISRKKSRKNRLVWIDLCPKMRKLNPYYDFTKLERPPSASYSSLFAGNGWIDLESSNAQQRAQSHVQSIPARQLPTHNIHRLEPTTTAPDDDASSISDEDQERVTEKEDDSWDMSMSEPGMSHDVEFDKPMQHTWAVAKEPTLPISLSRPPPAYQTTTPQHRASFPSSLPTKNVKTTSFPAQIHQFQMKDPSTSQNQQHSPQEDELKSNSHPRYLQHTKSSRNAKTIKSGQGRYAMPAVDDRRPVPARRNSKSDPVFDTRGPAQENIPPSNTTRLPTPATTPASRKQSILRPKTAPPVMSMASKGKPIPTSNQAPKKRGSISTPVATAPTTFKQVPPQPRPPSAPKAPTSEMKKTTPMYVQGSMPQRRVSSAKWR